MKNKTLVLDYSKWRCGDYGDNRLGSGGTCLLNNDGFMCCLGQFSTQLSNEITEKDIIGSGEPYEVGKRMPMLAKISDGQTINTALSNKAMAINDDENTTPEEKIEKLKSLFKKTGVEIKVINKPKNLTTQTL